MTKGERVRGKRTQQNLNDPSTFIHIHKLTIDMQISSCFCCCYSLNLFQRIDNNKNYYLNRARQKKKHCLFEFQMIHLFYLFIFIFQWIWMSLNIFKSMLLVSRPNKGQFCDGDLFQINISL